MIEGFFNTIKSQKDSQKEQRQVVSGYLKKLRKDYDSLMMEIKKIMTDISVKKKEIDFMRYQKKFTKGKFQFMNCTFTQKEGSKQQIVERHREAQMQQNILFNIIERMRKD